MVWWAIGELDLANERYLVERVTESFDRPRRTIVVDLSQLIFIDASGIAALVKCYKYALARHVRFHVRGAVKEVAKVLELTGVSGPLSDSG